MSKGDAVMSLEGFGVAFGQHIVLADINLEVPRTGVVNLLGPAGTGKSTLLRTLAGLNDAQPAMRTWGSLCIEGEEVDLDLRRRRDQVFGQQQAVAGRRVAMVVQDARFLTATVRENLASGLGNRSSLTKTEQDELLIEFLELNALEDLADRLEDNAIDLPIGLQRCLAVARAALNTPLILCVDEGTMGVSDDHADRLLSMLASQAESRAILFVTHNQQHAKDLGGRSVLLAGGRVQESASTEEFFANPQSDAARSFVRTGSCSVAAPTAKKEELSDSVAPPPPLPLPAQRAVASRHVGPTGFYWLKPGRMGGLPRPGIVASLEDDLAGLGRLGTTVLVTLEERRTVPEGACAGVGIKSIFFPIIDMKVPTFADAERLARQLNELMRRGESVAVHCRAGLGRTGTILACQLVWEGCSPIVALEQVRGINPKFIQSTEQVEFLSAYSQWLKGSREGQRASL